MKHTVEEVQLKNGAKGLLIDVPNTSVVNMLAGFNSGALFCDPIKYPELSHVMEHVMMGANKHFPTQLEFKAEIEKNGAYANAYTSDYFNTYEFECAEFEADSIIDLLSAELSTPLFLESEVKAEIGNVKEELSGYLSDYSRVAYDQLIKYVLARPTYEDSLATVDAITAGVAKSYYRRTHTVANMRFIFAGAVNKHPKLVKQFEAGISAMPIGTRLPIPKLIPRHLAEPVYVHRPIPQVYYQFMQFCPKLSIEEEPAMALLSILLTGRHKSRIFGTARDRGLAYGVYSGSSNEVGYAYMAISFFSTPANIKALFKLIAEQLREVQKGKISQQEVDEAKQLMLGRRMRNYKTPNNLINWYAGWYALYDHIEPFKKGSQDIVKIQVADVQRIARHLLKTPKWGLSLVGDISQAKALELHKVIGSIWR